MWTTDWEDIAGRAAAGPGRVGSFNPEEQPSSRFRSYGPPLREERLRSFRSCTYRPTGGGPARVARRGRAGGRGREQSDEDEIGGNRRIGVQDRSCRGLAMAGSS